MATLPPRDENKVENRPGSGRCAPGDFESRGRHCAEIEWGRLMTQARR